MKDKTRKVPTKQEAEESHQSGLEVGGKVPLESAEKYFLEFVSNLLACPDLANTSTVNPPTPRQ